VRVSLANNDDLRLAAARIEEAWGFYRSQRSALFPAIDAAGGWSRGRIGNIPPTAGITAGQFDLSGLLSYEVDIWGRLRRLTEAARAELLAAEEGRRTVMITLIASVATAYMDLLALDEQLRISQRTVASRRGSLELTREKFADGRGIVSELDVRQAETLLYGAEATLLEIERLIALRQNEISLLLGRNPGPVPRGVPLAEQTLVDAIPAGLPSDLLLRRPDLRAAEQQLIAANANIGAARAAYFPTISLTAALGLQSVELPDLFDMGPSRSWRIAPQVVAPIFNAGRIRAGVQVAEARQQAVLISYEQAIRSAFREVEDALVSVRKLGEQLEAQQRTVGAERARLELSELRYEGGVTSYTEVLDAQRFLFDAELALADVRRARLVAMVQLYRALGGGW
jgi:multidrug efflux system outer membrane protein